MAKVISIFNHKGGPGKTTVTSIFANQLAYEKGARVLVVDADNYQKSFFDCREQEKYEIQEGILTLENELYPIIVEKPSDIPELIEAEGDNYDYIFIDLGGSTGLQGVITALTYVDRLIVPVMNSVPTLSSTVRFIDGTLTQLYEYWETETENDSKIGFLLNDVSKRSFNTRFAIEQHTAEVAQYLEIEKLNATMFQNVLYREESELKDNFQTHQKYLIRKEPNRYEDLYEEMIKFIE